MTTRHDPRPQPNRAGCGLRIAEKRAAAAAAATCIHPPCKSHSRPLGCWFCIHVFCSTLQSWVHHLAYLHLITPLLATLVLFHSVLFRANQLLHPVPEPRTHHHQYPVPRLDLRQLLCPTLSSQIAWNLHLIAWLCPDGRPALITCGQLIAS